MIDLAKNHFFEAAVSSNLGVVERQMLDRPWSVMPEQTSFEAFPRMFMVPKSFRAAEFASRTIPSHPIRQTGA